MSVQGLARSSPEHGISEEDEMVVGVEVGCQLFNAGAVNCTVRIVARLLVDGLPFLERIHLRHGYPLSSCEILKGCSAIQFDLTRWNQRLDINHSVITWDAVYTVRCRATEGECDYVQ